MASFITSLLLATTVSVGIGVFFWYGLLGFLFSLIPPTADYAWIGKLLCIIIVGYFGGIGIPLISFFAIMWFWATCSKYKEF